MTFAWIKRAISMASAVTVAAVLAFSSTSVAQAENMGAAGGYGGGDYSSPCRPPDALIGINLRSGTALDAVTAICIPLTQNRKEWAGQAYEPTQYWGGNGGGYQKIACQPGDVVRRLRVATGPWGDAIVVKHIGIECEDLASDYTYKVIQKNPKGTVTKTRWIGCGQNQIGSGIYGRSGALVDRIGLACGKF